jgi:hypothetical protein
MKTAAEYRAMAEECFRWAREAKANAVRGSLQQLAQVWLENTRLQLTLTFPDKADLSKVHTNVFLTSIFGNNSPDQLRVPGNLGQASVVNDQ